MARSSLCVPLAVVLATVLLGGCTPDVEYLRNRGDVEGLIEALSHSDSVELRTDAAEALGELADARAVDALVGALEDESEDVRRAAAAALGVLGNRAALEGLLAALSDPAATVRETAAEALGRLGQQEAVVPLLIAFDDSSSPVAEAAKRAFRAVLADLDDRNAVAVLVSALEHEAPGVRAAAAAALGQLRQQGALVPLLVALEDPSPEVGKAAELALRALLGALDVSDGAAALLSEMNHELPSVREAAHRFLRELFARIGPDRAADVIVRAGAGDALLAEALGVPEHRLAVETRLRDMQLEDLSSIREALASLREGVPVPEAHPYEPSDEFHPAVVFGSDDVSPPEWAQEGIGRWAPTALRFVELVIIEEDHSEVLEVCPYDGPSITRYRPVLTVRVLSAHDGHLVDERSFRGSDPRQCAATEPYHLTELYGDPPDFAADAIPWLESLIHPPGAL